ncbi:MAG: DUF167 domain-containing protein [Thermoplasmata archaeon]
MQIPFEMIEDALIAHAKGVSIRLDVLPRSEKSAIPGYDEWRKRMRVSLKEKPHRGAANKELLRLMSEIFGVDRSSVKITEGLRSRRKTVLVEGIGMKDALETISRVLQ